MNVLNLFILAPRKAYTIKERTCQEKAQVTGLNN